MRIVVDYRERRSGLIELLEEKFDVEIGSLACGDYLINGRLLVERKTARDLLLSLVDLRLFRQIARLKDADLKSVFIVEGDPFRTDLDFSCEAITGTLLSLQAAWQMPIIFTRSKRETASTLLAMGRQEEKFRDVVLLRGGYRPKRLRTRQLYLLQGLPGVGPIIAKRLLDRFGTPSIIFNSSMKELAAVRGVGKKRAHVIREILDGKL